MAIESIISFGLPSQIKSSGSNIFVSSVEVWLKSKGVIIILWGFWIKKFLKKLL